MLSILGLLLPTIGSVLNKIIPDANARQAAQDEITKALIERQGEVDQAIAEAAKAQAQVNLAEAQSPSLFVAGWRPFVGWVCGIGCAYAFILQPVINEIANLANIHSPAPALDSASMIGLLMGLLGLGGMRTAEKIQGVDRQNMGKIVR